MFFCGNGMFSFRSENYAETLLNNIFRLLPQEAFDEKIKKTLDYFSTQAPNILSGGALTTYRLLL